MTNPSKGAPPRPPRRHLAYGRWTPAFFLAPAIVALLAVGLYPTIFAVVTPFRRYNITRTRDGFPFIGFDNYVAVLTDPSFWGALGVTAGVGQERRGCLGRVGLRIVETSREAGTLVVGLRQVGTAAVVHDPKAALDRTPEGVRLDETFVRFGIDQAGVQ